MTDTGAVRLLHRWSELTREYARTALERSKAVSARDRAWLSAALEDVKEQATVAILDYRDLRRHGQFPND